MVYKTMVKWGVLANTSTRRLPADFTLPSIAATGAAGTENEEINQSIICKGALLPPFGRLER